MKTTWIFLGLMLVNIAFLFAQDKNRNDSIDIVAKDDISNHIGKTIKNIKVSAYFQGQYQHGQRDVRKMMVGSDNQSYKKSFSRFGVRRAFVSTMYEQGLVHALFTLEAKDNADIWFSDAFINITDSWTKRFNLTIGSMNPEFGYELSVLLSKYELLERTSFLYSLMLDIYDIGAKISYQAPEKFGNLKINANLVRGNGV